MLHNLKQNSSFDDKRMYIIVFTSMFKNRENLLNIESIVLNEYNMLNI